MKQRVERNNKPGQEEVRLVFASTKYSFYAPYIKEDGYVVDAFLRMDNLVSNGIWDVLYRFFKKRPAGWYNPRLKNYEGTYIIFDARVQLEDLLWLKKKNPKARMVFCYVNPIESSKIELEKVREAGFEVWSYGDKQCEKYGVKQFTSFYCKSMYRDALKKENVCYYDLIFIGKDKGRREQLRSLIRENGWEQLNWRLYFTRDHIWEIYKKGYEKKVTYREVQCMQREAKAILEITPSEDVDITMRTTDAMILGKKLVTNSKNASQKEYYHPDNIFIIGVDAPERLPEFLKAEYHPVSGEILDKYRFPQWIRRILEDQPVNRKA